MIDYRYLKLSSHNQDIYFHLKLKVKIVTDETRNFKGKILDVGCGRMPYRDIILNNSNITEYIGVDIENETYQDTSKPDFFWDGKRLPFETNYFDNCILIEVLEHVPDPNVVLKEISRVLKKDANLLITVPFLWNLHDVPHDEYRYTPFSLKRICEEAGFTIVKVEGLGGWHASLATMLSLFARRAPLSRFKRKLFSFSFLPLVKYLFRIDRFNFKPSEFKEGQMITGLKLVLKNGS